MLYVRKKKIKKGAGYATLYFAVVAKIIDYRIFPRRAPGWFDKKKVVVNLYKRVKRPYICTAEKAIKSRDEHVIVTRRD